MHSNLATYDDEYVVAMARVWSGALSQIPTKDLAYWFGEAHAILAYDADRGSRFTSMLVWYAFQAHRDGTRPAANAPDSTPPLMQ